jgi:5-methylcytosine-specific restriction enzyme subunit McrC
MAFSRHNDAGGKMLPEPLVITDLTSEAHWQRSPNDEEREWLAEIAELSPQQFVLNAQLEIDHQPTTEPILTRDIEGWRANRYIGEIRHNGRKLVIEPRLGIETITSWISAILNVQVLPRTAQQIAGANNAVTQLLAALWRASVLTAGQHALPRMGQKLSSHGLSVKGRLDGSATSRRRAKGHFDLVSTRVVRSYDNAPARAVVLADRYFDRHLAGAQWRGPRLDEQMVALRNATGTRPQRPSLIDIRKARYSPITIKWRRAAELSWRIISKDPLGVAADDDSTYGVLIDVAELWEMFVLHCAVLATSQPVLHGTNTQSSGHLARSTVDSSRALGKLYPDVLVGDRPITALLDAKYKRLGGRRGIGREDLYQLHAYSSTFESPLAALVYPAIDSEIPRDERDSPWRTNSGELSFLTLPTDAQSCVAKLKEWFQAGNCL